jgi:hypothetical protein
MKEALLPGSRKAYVLIILVLAFKPTFTGMIAMVTSPSYLAIDM